MRLQTHLVVREDALTLYGFASQRERWLFVALLGRLRASARRRRSRCSRAIPPTRCSARSRRATWRCSPPSPGSASAPPSGSSSSCATSSARPRSRPSRRARTPARRRPAIRTSRRARPSSRSASPWPRPRPRWPAPTGSTEQRVKDGARRRCGAEARHERGEDERLVGAAAARGDEDETDRSLRPRQLEEFVGQEVVREQLAIALAAAKERGEPIDHVLLAGPPGPRQVDARAHRRAPRWTRG